MNNGTPKLGIDIGRVIIDGSSHPTGDDTAFFKGGIGNALRTPAMPGAFEAVTLLVEQFDGRVWLVSKCGERVQLRTREWLAHHRFFEQTGIDPENLRFCRERPQKAIHCRELEITHFVDDRPDVLVALDGIVPHRYLFGPQREGTPRGAIPVLTWSQALATVETDLARHHSEPAAGHGVPVLAGREAEGVADQVQHTGLHDRLRPGGGDRVG